MVLITAQPLQRPNRKQTAPSATDARNALKAGLHDAGSAIKGMRLVSHTPKAAAFDSLRGLPDFRNAVRRAEDLQREALDAFRAADGPRILGVPQL